MMLIPYLYHLQKGPLDLIETGKGLKVQTDKPHLVSLGSGRLSTAITLLPLEEGESGVHPACHPSILTDIPAWESRYACRGPSCYLLTVFTSPKWEAMSQCPPPPHPPACFPCLCLPRLIWLHDQD